VTPTATEEKRENLFHRVYERAKGSADGIVGRDGLGAKVIQGNAWLGTWSVGSQAARLVRNIILTRLLAPDAFGVMAIVLSVGSIIHTLTDMGVKESLVQNPRGAENHYADAAWWIALGRSLALYGALYAAAPWLAAIYKNPEVTPLLRVVSLGTIFDGAFSSKAYVAMKEMKFKKWAAIVHLGAISGIVITLILAIFLRNVWALVWGSVAESAASCAISYVFCPHFPSLSWNREAMRDLLRFSKGLVGLSFLNFIFARTDVFVLGKLFSPAALGLYVMAVYLVQTPVGFIMNMFGQTLFPAFSQIQGDSGRINRSFLKFTTAVAGAALPAVVLIFFCGRSVLTCFYGHRYAEAAPALMVAACIGIINVVNGNITTVFYSKGLPQLHRRCVALMAIAMIGLVYPCAKAFGLVGGQLAALAAIIIGYVSQLERMRSVTGLELGRYFKSLSVPAITAAGIALVFVAARPLVIGRPILNIILGLGVCAVGYWFGLRAVVRDLQKQPV
jgi:lipopolysaccharide exporter